MMEKLLQLPVVASEHGKAVDQFVVLVHWLMAPLFVGWLAFFIYTLWRFRASRQRKADYEGVKGHSSTWLELGVVAFEGVLLIGFAIPLWARAVDDFPSEKEATVMRVVGEQFGWSYIMPGKDGKFGPQDLALISPENPFGFDKTKDETKDNLITVNEVHVPVNKPVIMNFSSKDVIHSFKVVPLRVTQDCIPGLNIPQHFVPTKEGKYQVICAQLCGNGHAAMAAGLVVVESQSAYDAWFESKAAGGGPATTFE